MDANGAPDLPYICYNQLCHGKEDAMGNMIDFSKEKELRSWEGRTIAEYVAAHPEAVLSDEEEAEDFRRRAAEEAAEGRRGFFTELVGIMDSDPDKPREEMTEFERRLSERNFEKLMGLARECADGMWLLEQGPGDGKRRR